MFSFHIIFKCDLQAVMSQTLDDDDDDDNDVDVDVDDGELTVSLEDPD